MGQANFKFTPPMRDAINFKLFNFFNWANAWISLFKHTNNAYYVSQLYTTALQPNTLAGFEPRSSVPEADAMSTAHRRHPGHNWDFIYEM
jgi:hypothetical protein